MIIINDKRRISKMTNETLSLARLLQLYNKNTNTDNAIDTKAEDVNKAPTLGLQRRYGNPFEVLYNQMKTNKNFSAKMYEESLKEGTPDAYLSLLSENKDNTLSSQFYNNEYFDYYTNLTELMLQSADKTNSIDRKITVIDPYTGEEFEESIGAMSDYDWYNYQIAQSREAKAQEIIRERERLHKENMSGWDKFWNTMHAGLQEFGEGFASASAGLLDFLWVWAASGVDAAIEGEEWADKYVEWMGSKSLTALEKQTLRTAIDEYERLNTWIKDIDGNATTIGGWYAGVANSWGMMVPAMLTNLVLPGAGTYTFYMSIYSNNLYENATLREDMARYGHDSPAGIAIANAAIKSGAEAVIEWGIGKMFGGPSVPDIMRGAIGSTNVTKIVKSLTSKGAALKFLGKNMLQEGAEEFFQDFSNMLIDQFTGMYFEGYGQEGVNFRTLIDSFIVGALSSMLLTGGKIIGSRIKTASYNRTAGKAVRIDGDITTSKKNLVELEKKLSAATGDTKAKIENQIKAEQENITKLENKKINLTETLERRADWASVPVEIDGNLVELKGARKLMFNEMMAEFNKAVQELQKDGIKDSKSIELAQEIYGYAITMSTLFSSFDTTRLKNCLELLDRVSKAETQKNYTRLDKMSDWLTTKLSTDRTDILAAQTRLQERYDSYIVKQNREIVDTILEQVKEMTGEVVARHKLTTARKLIESESKKIVANVDKKTGKLKPIGADTDVFTDLNDNLKAENTIDNIVKDKLYDKIFITDGTVAIEDDKILFIPVSWLKNYTKSEIYKFLTQEKLIDSILYNETLEPFINDLMEFNKEFTPFTSMSPARALMNFMFNPSVAQGFILKENGKYLHRYSEFIFNLQNILSLEGSKLNAENKAYLEQIVQLIKNNLRIPTIKAIINWNIDPQTVHADTILDRADREFVKKWQVRKNLNGKVLNNEDSPQISRYIAQKSRILDFIEQQKGGEEIAEYVREHINDKPTSDTYKNAFLILEYYDRFMPKTQAEINNIPIIYNVYNNNQLLGLNDETDINDIQDINDKLQKFADTFNLKGFVENISNCTLNIKNYVLNKNLANAVLDLYDISMSELTTDIFVDGVVRLIENNLEERFTVQYKNSTLKIAKSVNHRDIFVKAPFQKKTGIVDYVIKYGKYNSEQMSYTIPLQSLFSNKVLNNIIPKSLLNAIMNTKVSDNYSQKLLDTNVVVKITDDIAKHGVYDGKNIVIYNTAQDSRVTFLHEFNHMLQDITGLFKGGNIDMVALSTEYLSNIAKTYKDAIYQLAAYDIEQMLEIGILNEDYTINEDFVIQENMTLEETTQYQKFIDNYINTLSTIGYLVLEGEIYSRHAHGRAGKGGQITSYENIIPVMHIMRKSDKVKTNHISKKDKMSTAKNMIVRSFANALEARDSGLDNGKYHSKLSKEQSLTLTEMISNKNLNTLFRTGLTIDQMIKEPNVYLSEDIRSKIDTTTEGTTFAGLKKYYENITGNISIDIDANTHRYVFVDNDTFSDMYNKNMPKDLSKEQSLTLGDVYSRQELEKLGIPEDIKIVISKDTLTETRFDKKNSNGIITIQLEGKDTQSDILHKINHEFRHILQKYNSFEGGFTPDFKVTDEMRKDIKKNLPELFDKDVVDTTLSDDELIQYLIYFMSTGELNAYGIFNDIMTRPIYETYEAGKPTIYMPWYDPKTNTGRYETEFLAGRMAEPKGVINIVTDKSIKKDIENVPVEILPKDDSVELTSRRKVTKADIKDGNNLKYFWKEREGGKLLSDDLISLIRATTGRETNLPADFMKLIYNGKLNTQVLYEYIKTRDLNNSLLDLLNDHIFKNNVITDIEMLSKASNQLVYAQAFINTLNRLAKAYDADTKQVLQRLGFDTENINMSLALDKLKITSPEIQNIYDRQVTKYFEANIDGKKTNIDIDKILTGKEGVSYDTDKFAQLLLLKYYDGTLEGIKKAAEAYRNSLIKSRQIEGYLAKSTSTEIIGKDGNNSRSLEDILTADMKNNGIYTAKEFQRLRKGIEGLIEDNVASREDMIAEIIGGQVNKLIIRYIQLSEKYLGRKLSAKERINLSEFIEFYINEFLSNEIGLAVEKKRTHKVSTDLERTADPALLAEAEEGPITTNNKIKLYEQNLINAKDKLNKMIDKIDFLSKVNDMSAIMEGLRKAYYKIFGTLQRANIDVIIENYNATLDNEVSGQYIDNPYALPYSRQNTNNSNLLNNVKRNGERLSSYIEKGVIKYDLLPKHVQAMFELVVTRSEKTGKKIGERYELKTEYRNPTKISTEEDLARYGKRRLLDSRKLAETNIILKEINELARKDVYRNKKNSDNYKKFKIKQEKAMKKATSVLGKLEKISEPKTKEIKVKEKYTRTDVPNNFVITSNVDMPQVLQDIFDVSFNRFADDKVQGTSKDESGNYYDKSNKDFKSRLEHEITSWKAFYEANREKLMSLTRDDALDIVRFISNGSTTINVILAQKLAAFELFTLGYIIDVARSNANSWNFSDSEIAKIEDLYTTLASTFGTGLSAVKQMLDVVNPYREVAQRQLDRFGIDEIESKPLFDAMKAYDNARTAEEKKLRLKEVLVQIDSTETLAITKYWSELDKKKKYIKKYKKSTDLGKQAVVKQYRKDLINLTWRRIKDIRYKAMLSSPVTGIRNRYSNAIQFSFIKASDAIADLVFRGIKKGAYRKGQIDMYNIKVSDNVRQFLNNEFKTAEGKWDKIVDMFLDYSTKYDTIGAKGSNKVGSFVKLVENVLEKKIMAGTVWQDKKGGKLMNAIDKYIQKNITDKPFVRRAAMEYMGKLLTLYTEQGTLDLSNGINYSVMEVFAESVILANEDYVRKYSPLSDYIAKLQEKHHFAYEVLSFWQPFINSGLNWFIEMTKYTPIGLGTAITRMIKLENNIAKIEADREKGKTRHMSSVEQYLIRRDIGKGIVGSVLFIVGALLGGLGIIKIDDDDDKFYLYIGKEVKIDISNVFGTSSILIGTALTQIFAKDEDGKSKYNFSNVIDMMSSAFFESFLLKDLIERHSFSDGFYEGMLTETESMMKSFVPQVVQLLVRLTNNKKIKYTPGFVGMLERYMNSFVPTQPFGETKINPYTGEPMTKYAIPILGEVLKSGFFGPRIIWQEVTDEQILCESYGISKKELTGKYEINGEEVEFKNKKVLNEYYGKLNKNTLDNLSKQSYKVQMSDGTYKTLPWDKLSDEQKANVISRLMSKNAEAAKVWYWTTQLGHKYYTSSSNIKALRDLGLNKNLFIGDKGFVK